MTIAVRLRPSFRPSFAYLSTALLAALLAACGDGAMPPGPGVDATVPPEDLGVDATVPPADLGAPDMTGPCGDADGDGARDAACGGTDCDDANPSRYPGATEVCDAADLDEDCDPETFGFRDADGDGFPDARCCNGTKCGDDCNDARPGVNPAVPEVCNAVDDDCDGSTDEDLLAIIYTDADRDGFGAGTPLTGCPGMAGTVTNGDDCDDARASSNPAAMEACDGVADDDCDGTVDEGCGCVTGTTRSCGVDTGVCEVGTQECIAGAWAMCTAVVAGTESCNGLDDDCDGETDEGLLVSGCCLDRDSDGFGTGAVSAQCRDLTRALAGFCPAGYTNSASPVDCNDTIAEIRPDGIERCDTLDNDCDGVVDDVIGLGDACTTGVGSCARSGTLACGGGMLVCSAVAGAPAAEACNGLDDDCDGIADDGLMTVFNCRVDADSDGFGVGATTAQCVDSSRFAFGGCPAGYTNTAQLDCNDIDPAIQPTATEACNLIDDDCDGVVDDGVQTAYYRDADNDGSGAGMATFACMAPSGFVTRNDDCNDTNNAIRPDATELCDGVIDHDCNGTVDNGCACTNGATQSCGSSVGLCTNGSQTCSGGMWGTCSGTAPRAEVCDGLDQDCDGTADDGVTTNYYPDTDADGFGAGVARAACTAPVGYVANSTDCNDAANTVRPGAPEICNGLDDDCDGTVDESCTCTPGSTRSCGISVGACTTGTQTCTGTGWTACTGVAPSVETCNGSDDDCDGTTDEFPSVLTGLTISCGALSPAFNVATTMYRVHATPGTTTCVVQPTVACPASMAVLVNDSTVPAGGSVTLTFASWASAISIRVIAVDGTSTRYDVVINRGSTYIKASNTDSGDFFGTVALSADGTTLAVGATGEDSAATGIGGDQASNASGTSGAVYVYRRSAGGAWAQEAYVKASNTEANDTFGQALALSEDGSTLAVGAYIEDSAATGVGGDQASNAASGSGAVYVFRRSVGVVWAQEAYVKASNTGSADDFGNSFALSGDGATLAVGAHREGSAATGVGGDQASNAASASGAVYVFRRSVGGVWAQEAYVKASNTGAGDLFGNVIALSADGTGLAVGAPGEDSAATGVGGNQASNTADGSGAVYVFRRSVAGSWSQEVYVKASNTQGGPSSSFGGDVNGDSFGDSITFAADGSTLAVGATDEDSAATGIAGDQASNAARDAGAVYVFRRSTSGIWIQEAYVKSSNTEPGCRPIPFSGCVGDSTYPRDLFGRSVSLSASGEVLAVGASGEDSSANGIDGDQSNNSAIDAGAAYVFRRSVGGVWTQEAYVKASNTGSGDLFGSSVALSGDGATLAVGAYSEDSAATGIGGDQANNAAPHSGAVYVF